MTDADAERASRRTAFGHRVADDDSVAPHDERWEPFSTEPAPWDWPVDPGDGEVL